MDEIDPMKSEVSIMMRETMDEFKESMDIMKEDMVASIVAKVFKATQQPASKLGSCQRKAHNRGRRYKSASQWIWRWKWYQVSWSLWIGLLDCGGHTPSQPSPGACYS